MVRATRAAISFLVRVTPRTGPSAASSRTRLVSTSAAATTSLASSPTVTGRAAAGPGNASLRCTSSGRVTASLRGVAGGREGAPPEPRGTRSTARAPRWRAPNRRRTISTPSTAAHGAPDVGDRLLAIGLRTPRCLRRARARPHRRRAWPYRRRRTIDLEIDRQPTPIDHLSHGLDLREHGRQERLAAEAGFTVMKQARGRDLRGRTRSRSRACGDSARPRRAFRASGCATGFAEGAPTPRHAHLITSAPASAKASMYRFRLYDHEMHVERQRRGAPRRADHDGAERDVRDEATVHHVDVDPIGAGGLHVPDFRRRAARGRR